MHPGPTDRHLLPAAAGAAHTRDGSLSWGGDGLVLLLLGALERRRRRGAQFWSLKDKDTRTDTHTSLTHSELLALESTLSFKFVQEQPDTPGQKGSGMLF